MCVFEGVCVFVCMCTHTHVCTVHTTYEQLLRGQKEVPTYSFGVEATVKCESPWKLGTTLKSSTEECALLIA